MEKKKSPKKPPQKRNNNWLATALIGKEKDYFIENMSMLIASGMSILAALESIKKEVRSGTLKRLISEMKDDIDAGSSLSDALESTRLLPPHIFSLIKIGEETGRLPENLQVIVLTQQKERIFHSKIRSAMMYPVLVLSFSMIIGIGIAWFILPRLATVFAQLKMELPLLTRVLIAIGDFLRVYGSIAIPLLIIVIITIIYLVFYFAKTKFIGQKILFLIPGIKGLIQELELARFGFIFGTLLQVGVPITKALNSLCKASSIKMYTSLYEHLKQKIEQGDSFQMSFKSYKKSHKLIPTPIQEMIIAGEQSGNLPEILLRVSRTFEAKTETSTKNLAVILEPIMLIIVWLGVVGVALAVILPIYNLIGGFNQNVSSPPPPPATIPIEKVEMITEEEAEVLLEVDDSLGTVEILSTETGYLNVRREANTSADILTKVLPGETYKFTDHEGEWYEINYLDEESGWVFGQYVEEIEP